MGKIIFTPSSEKGNARFKHLALMKNPSSLLIHVSRPVVITVLTGPYVRPSVSSLQTQGKQNTFSLPTGLWTDRLCGSLHLDVIPPLYWSTWPTNVQSHPVVVTVLTRPSPLYKLKGNKINFHYGMGRPSGSLMSPVLFLLFVFFTAAKTANRILVWLWKRCRLWNLLFESMILSDVARWIIAHLAKNDYNQWGLIRQV